MTSALKLHATRPRQTARKSMGRVPFGLKFAANPFQKKKRGRPKKQPPLLPPVMLTLEFKAASWNSGPCSSLSKDVVYKVDCKNMSWNSYKGQPIIAVFNFTGQHGPKYWNEVLNVLLEETSERKIPGARVNLAPVKLLHVMSPCKKTTDVWELHPPARVQNSVANFFHKFTMVPFQPAAEKIAFVLSQTKRKQTQMV